MPLENTGNRVVDIQYVKDIATIYLENGKEITSSNDVLLDNLVYIGKILSDEEIAIIIESSSYDECLKKSLKLVSRYVYTNEQLKNKLLTKYSIITVKKVLDYLEENNLLDDDLYIKDYVFFGNSKLWGKDKIISKLLEKGIDREKIKETYFPRSIEKNKIESLMKSLESKYQNYNSHQKKEHIYVSLLRNGYEHDLIDEALENLKGSDDYSLLVNDYIKIKEKVERKYDDYKARQNIVGYLLQKGYNYSDIKKIMEDDENDD